MTIAIPERTHSVLLTVLILSYVAGVIGLRIPAVAPYFALLTPVHLVASLAVLLLYHTDWRPAFLIYAVLAILTGFFVEVLGVHTGYIFGEYAYGPGLGPHLWSVPPVIGLNWLLLSYCSGSVCDRLPLPLYMKTIAAATLMVVLDFFIEPVAVQLNFWSWTGGIIPLRNYLAWWFVGLGLLGVWYGLPFRKQNRMAGWLLGLQFFFFIGHRLLNLL